MPAVAVTIVSYETAQLTLRATSSALSSAADEVVVVDNASRDSTLPDLEALTDGRLSVVRNCQNEGFGSAANAGAREASAEWLIFLNSDAELSRAAVETIVSELRGRHGRAVVGPRLTGQEGGVQRSAGLLPGPVDLAVRTLGIHALGRVLGVFPLLGPVVRRSKLAREHASAEAATETIDTTMVSGACFAIGREAFWELGGFDERFFMYFEDADLCRRAAAAGMPIRYVPSAVVTHIGGGSSSEDYHFGPLHARAMRQYLGKWYGPGGSALAVLLLWLRAVALTLALRGGSRRAWHALWATLRDHDPRS